MLSIRSEVFKKLKKKIIITLSILLPILLLGYCTKSYASIEIGQVQNFIYNRSVEMDYSKALLDDWFLHSTAWSNFKSYIQPYCTDNYDQLLISSGYNIYFMYRAKDSGYKINIRAINNNGASYNITANGFAGFQTRYNDNNLAQVNNSTSHNSVNYCYSTADWYYNNSVYLYGTICLPSDSIIEGEYYTNIIWQFVPTGQQVTINGSNQWAYQYIEGSWSTNLGSLTDSEWCENIKYRVATWDNNLKKFSPYSNKYYELYDYDKNGPLYRYWTSTNNNGVYTTPISINTSKYQNCLIQLIITSEIPNELTTFYIDYIIGNTKSYVSGGVFYPNLTFSGDYVNEYNNQIQENKEEDNNDFWKEVYDDLFTMDSGEVQQLLDDFIENVDLEEYGDIQIEQGVLNVLNGEPTDFIISWGAVYTPYIASIGSQRQKIIESGEINFSQMARQNQGLKSASEIARIICSFTIIILLLKNIWFTLMRVLGVGTAMYEDQQEEASRLEAVSGETININGETGEYTRTLTYYDPKTNYRQNIHYNPNRRRKR